jgi:hypothetical protein
VPSGLIKNDDGVRARGTRCEPLADFRQADGEVFLKVSIAAASCL